MNYNMNTNLQGIGMTSEKTRAKLIVKLREMGIVSEQVLATIMSTPRHIFIDEALASRAYKNVALPIGYNQTISQPYVVAKMVESLLGDDSTSQTKNIMEIGSGCGYQTAILAQLVKYVYSIERIEALAKKAQQKLRLLKFSNTRIKHDNGAKGWPQHAPFDGIIVSAAPASIPQMLLEQLAINGRLVLPVGHTDKQRLLLITRTENGFKERELDIVKFVPMVEGALL